MTVTDILAIVGRGEDGADFDQRLFAAADRFAEADMTAGLPLLIADNTEHFDAFHEIAREVEGDELEQIDDQLKSLNLPETPDVAGLACNRWTPEIHTAYYFGVAFALRLPGGAR